jgi:DnaJ-class molecular chaperone
MNHYELLGIKQNATLRDIKRAYKEKVREWHPDKHQDNKDAAETMFKNIVIACEVLLDNDKRDKYDLSISSNKNAPTPNVIIPLVVTLKDMYEGGFRDVDVVRYNICYMCNGIGTLDPDDVCQKCKGCGVVYKKVSGEYLDLTCEHCSGVGVHPSADLCEQCDGKKCHKETISLTVRIPRGVYTDYQIKIIGEGNEIPIDERVNSDRSDIVFTVMEIPEEHITFKRNWIIPGLNKIGRFDLLINLNVSFIESLIGFEKKIKDLSGKTMYITSHLPVRHGDLCVLQNHGLPIINTKEFGDLYINIYVQHPNELDKNILDDIVNVFEDEFISENNSIVQFETIYSDLEKNKNELKYIDPII